jgi:hypothetical protein
VPSSATRHIASPKQPPQWTAADIRRVYNPAYNQLPFVRPVLNGNILEKPASFWNDVPSGDDHADYKRGKQHAHDAINDLAEDECSGWPLERTFIAIIQEAVARKSKGGKHSRSLTPAVDGFLHNLSKLIRDAAVQS